LVEVLLDLDYQRFRTRTWSSLRQFLETLLEMFLETIPDEGILFGRN
jgi:hypothetical protein